MNQCVRGPGRGVGGRQKQAGDPRELERCREGSRAGFCTPDFQALTRAWGARFSLLAQLGTQVAEKMHLLIVPKR